ncbi:unnamed protein product [Camellia sinensis]
MFNLQVTLLPQLDIRYGCHIATTPMTPESTEVYNLGIHQEGSPLEHVKNFYSLMIIFEALKC